jgi:Xaa-Pro aminopeptidase
MCFTIEPKVWKPGIFYVRCEDVVVVGKERGASLTKFHYDPNVIG